MADKKIPTPTPVKAIAVARPSRPGGAALATKAIPQIIITATAAPISPRHQANHQKPPGTMQAKRARAAKAKQTCSTRAGLNRRASQPLASPPTT